MFEIFENGNLDGFDDFRVKLITYYVISFYLEQSVAEQKQENKNLYLWLVKNKSSLETIKTHSYKNLIIYYLENYNIDKNDIQGQADLDDVLISLKE